MAKPDSWMPLYLADYRADTIRLSTEQHGAYLLILMDYWRNGPPPDDDRVLAQITGLTLQRWKAHRQTIQAFFTIGGGVWKQKRAEFELKKARELQVTLSERAVKAAAARWGNELTNGDAQGHAQAGANGDATSMHGDMLGDAPSPSPSPNTVVPPPKKKPNGHKHASAFELPDWIPKEPWDAWIEARKKQRNAPTDFALKLAVAKLQSLRDEGYSPAHVLATAAFNGWTGLWKPKE